MVALVTAMLFAWIVTLPAAPVAVTVEPVTSAATLPVVMLSSEDVGVDGVVVVLLLLPSGGLIVVWAVIVALPVAPMLTTPPAAVTEEEASVPLST